MKSMEYKIKTGLTIPDELKSEIVDFTLYSGLTFFKVNPAGNNRRFCNLNLYDITLTNKIKEFSVICYNCLGIEKVNDEHIYGNFIGVNSVGGFVHEHSDSEDHFGRWHVRLNFMIQKPLEGGDVVIDGVKFLLNEGDSWLNFASKWSHGSTPVKGDRNRIVLSLGNYIDNQVAEKFYDSVR